MKRDFTVIYLDQSGQEQELNIKFDTSDYELEDFLGGSGQEAIEDIFLARRPGCEWISLELPEEFEDTE